MTNAGHNYGPVTLEKATTSSINTAYVDLTYQMTDGPEKIIQAANDVGIPEGLNWRLAGTDTPDPRIALGNGQVSPLDSAHGLSTLTNGGERTTTHMVEEVSDLTGDTVFTADHETTQAVEADVAQNAVYALTGVTKSGTGRTVNSLGHDVAGKTGTYYISDLRETRASWFIGSTAQISTAVMFVAGEQGESNLGAYSSGFYGSGFPAATWLEYMKVAMDGMDKVSFDGPTTVKSSGKFGTTPTPRATATRPTTSATPTPEPTTTSATPQTTPTQTTEPTPDPTTTTEPGGGGATPDPGGGGNGSPAPGGKQTP